VCPASPDTFALDGAEGFSLGDGDMTMGCDPCDPRRFPSGLGAFCSDLCKQKEGCRKNPPQSCGGRIGDYTTPDTKAGACAKAARYAACIGIRDGYDAFCAGGQNAGHKEQVDNLKRGLATCALRCAGPDGPPVRIPIPVYQPKPVPVCDNDCRYDLRPVAVGGGAAIGCFVIYKICKGVIGGVLAGPPGAAAGVLCPL
jgi:hypothetical protein